VDTVPGLKELEARKRDLLLESELNRQTVRLELRTIRLRADQLQRGFGWVQQVWKWGAPLAGFLFARKFQKKAGVFAKGSFVVSAATSLWKAWRAARGGSTKPPGSAEFESRE
jgi:hypothetical protein